MVAVRENSGFASLKKPGAGRAPDTVRDGGLSSPWLLPARLPARLDIPATQRCHRHDLHRCHAAPRGRARAHRRAVTRERPGLTDGGPSSFAQKVDLVSLRGGERLETEAMASFLRQGPGAGAGGLLPGRLSAAFRGSALPGASQSPCRVPGAGAGAFAAAPSPLAAPPGWAAGFHATAAACKQKFTGIVVSDKMNKSGAAARAHGQTGVRGGTCARDRPAAAARAASRPCEGRAGVEAPEARCAAGTGLSHARQGARRTAPVVRSVRARARRAADAPARRAQWWWRSSGCSGTRCWARSSRSARSSWHTTSTTTSRWATRSRSSRLAPRPRPAL